MDSKENALSNALVDPRPAWHPRVDTPVTFAVCIACTSTILGYVHLSLTEQDFSGWSYAAILIAVSIPAFAIGVILGSAVSLFLGYVLVHRVRVMFWSWRNRK